MQRLRAVGDRSPGRQRVLPAGAEHLGRRLRVARASISTRCKAPTPTTLYTYAPDPHQHDRRPAHPARRDVGPADHQPAAHYRRRPRQGARAGHRPRSRCAASSTRQFGTRQVATLYTPNNQYPDHRRERSRASSAMPRDLAAGLSAHGERPAWCRSNPIATDPPHRRSAAGRAPAAAAGGDDLLQPRARRRARATR